MPELSEVAKREIIQWAREFPNIEVCGMVWARDDVQTVWGLRNVHPEPTKYWRVAPADLREAYRIMDDTSGSPIAFYHSHPSGRRDPSEEDMQGALNVGLLYVIAYPVGLEWELSEWECIAPQVLVEKL